MKHLCTDKRMTVCIINRTRNFIQVELSSFFIFYFFSLGRISTWKLSFLVEALGNFPLLHEA